MTDHRFTRYECPSCEKQIDLHHFGTVHHSGIGCVECDESMELMDVNIE